MLACVVWLCLYGPNSVVLFLFFGWECCALDLFVYVVFLFFIFLWERNSVINTKTFFS